MTTESLANLSCSVTTTAERPFVIVSASATWHETWGYTPEESIGKSIALLNGDGHCALASKKLMDVFRREGLIGWQPDVPTKVCVRRRTDPNGVLRSRPPIVFSHAFTRFAHMLYCQVRCLNPTKTGEFLEHYCTLSRIEGGILCTSTNFARSTPALSALVEEHEKELEQLQLDATSFKGKTILDENDSQSNLDD